MNKIFGLLFFVILVNIIFAQSISYNEEFLVNSNIYGWQAYPSICSLTNGGFVICWESSLMDGNGTYIFAKIYDKNRVSVGNEFQVNTYINSGIHFPSICSLTNGGFVISWEGYDQDVNGYGIYAQIFDENGTKFGNEFLVNISSDSWQIYPHNIGLSNERFVTCWQRTERDGINTEIYAQIFDENGIKVGHEFQVNTFTASYQEWPSICNLKNSRFIISWQSDEQDGDITGIYAQIFDENGTKVGKEFQVNTFTKYTQTMPSICVLIDNRFIISWESYGQDGDGTGIYAQIYDENGAKIGSEFQVNSYTKSMQVKPSISGLSNGGFVISWQSGRDGSSYGIYAQIFDENGIKVGDEFKVNNYTYSEQDNPSACALTNNGFVISWQSFGQDGSGYGVYEKYYLNEPINHILIDFNLQNPLNDKTLDSIDLKFTWNQASKIHINFPWEIAYDLYIDINENFMGPIIIKGIQDTTYQISSLTPGNTYFWKVLAKNYYGDSLWSSNVNGFYIDPTATDIEDISTEIPSKFELYQNYPNPFNPTTTIRYSIPTVETHGHASVQLKIYDVLGRLVKVLVNETQKPGNYTIEFNGSKLTSGIYYYTVTAGEFSVTKKMLLLK